MADDLIGSQIDGWRVLSLLGQGAMGNVYDARKGNARAALKVISPESAADDSLARFRREAKLLQKIKHPHVVRCYAWGERGAQVYLLLEYLDGGTLEELLERTRRLTIPQAVGVARAVLEGLGAIHDQGVVHRDVKPANLLLDGSGRVVLADFGLARKSEASTSLTATGTILGTPFYMAPEQIRGETLDGRTDLYAVGVMIYHLIVGDPPYDGKNALAILQQHVNAEVPDLRAKVPQVPPRLSQAVAQLMAKETRDRPQDAKAALALLKGLEAAPLQATGVRATSSRRARAASGSSDELVAVAAAGGHGRAPRLPRKGAGGRRGSDGVELAGPKPLPRVPRSRLFDLLVLLMFLPTAGYLFDWTARRQGGDTLAQAQERLEGVKAQGGKAGQAARVGGEVVAAVQEARPWLDGAITSWSALVVLLLFDRLLSRLTCVGPLGRLALRGRARRLLRQGEVHAAALVYEQLGQRLVGAELLLAAGMPLPAAELFGAAGAFQRQGDALLAAGKKDEALLAYRAAGVDEEGDAAAEGEDSSREAAEKALAKGKLDKAIALHRRAGRHYDAADLLEKEGRTEEAVRELETAYQAGGGRDYWHHTGKKGPVEEARPELARRIALLQRKLGRRELAAGYYEKAGDLVEAASFYEEAGDLRGKARCLLGGVPAQGALNSYQRERVEEAARALASLKDPSALDLFIRIEDHRSAAELSKELGQLKEAAALFAQAGMPAEGAACAEEAKDLERAAELYVEAGNHRRASELLEQQGELEAAAEQARRAGSRERQAELLQRAGKLLDAARTLNELGREADALKILDGIKKRHDDYQESRGVLGDVHYRAKRLAEAAQAYAQWLPEVIHFREEVPVLLNYVACLEGLGQIEAAVEALSRLDGKEFAPTDLRQRKARLSSLRLLQGTPASASSSSHTQSSSNAGPSAGAQVAAGVAKPTDLVGSTQGNYQLLRFVGEGSFAWVYEGRHKESGQEAAIKVLKPSLTSGEAPKKFLQEGRSLAQLKNPHLVSIYDMGDVDGVYYLALEFVKGDTLKKLIADDAPFPVPKAARIAAQILNALAHAHAHGVAHRDLKPANVLVGRGSLVKVLDFGLAQAFDDATQSGSGGYLGTPRYASPEQARGEPAGPAADQYAAGLILYEMLTGKLPFDSKTSLGFLALHATEPPRPLQELRSDVPAPLAAVVMRALAKRPQDRFPDARAFEKALAGFLPRRGAPAGGKPR